MKFHPKLLVFLCAFSIALSAKQRVQVEEPEKGVVSFKMIKCDVSSKFVFSNYSCRVKSYSRSLSTASISFYFKQPIYEAFVSFELLRDKIDFSNLLSQSYAHFKFAHIHSVCGSLTSTKLFSPFLSFVATRAMLILCEFL
jgi:hypothetical protein